MYVLLTVTEICSRYFRGGLWIALIVFVTLALDIGQIRDFWAKSRGVAGRTAAATLGAIPFRVTSHRPDEAAFLGSSPKEVQ